MEEEEEGEGGGGGRGGGREGGREGEEVRTADQLQVRASGWGM